jgi:DNA-binding FadR family transcriptional regulator
MEHDIAFHEAIGRASRNPMFACWSARSSVITRQTWGIGWKAGPATASAWRASKAIEHRRAIARRREPRRRAMAEHFDLTRQGAARAGIN